jgi:hypothetical protein
VFRNPRPWGNEGHNSPRLISEVKPEDGFPDVLPAGTRGEVGSI